jgi:hypothetical protein
MFVVASQPLLDTFGRGFPGFQMADLTLRGAAGAGGIVAFSNQSSLLFLG